MFCLESEFLLAVGGFKVRPYFYLVFYGFCTEFYGVKSSFTGFYWVKMGFIECFVLQVSFSFRWVQGPAVFSMVLYGFSTQLYGIKSNCTGFYWVKVDFIGCFVLKVSFFYYRTHFLYNSLGRVGFFLTKNSQVVPSFRPRYRVVFLWF